MKKITLVFTLIGLLLAMVTVSAQDAADCEGFTIDAAETVEQAVTCITTVLEGTGARVPLVVDHRAAAESVGLNLRPTTTIFFGNPNIGTPIMVENQLTGIDLPLKFLVWEDEEGEIHLSYNTTGYIADRHGIEGFDELFERVSGVLGQFGENEIYVMPEMDSESDDMDNGLIILDSNQSFDDTVASLQTSLEAGDFRIPLVLDHSAAAASVDLELLPTTLIVFGNPAIGTPLMQANQAIGLDLPLKFLVWEDAEGAVRIAYNDPHYLEARHNDINALLNRITNGVGNLAQTGVGEE